MLVLTRKIDEEIVVNSDVVIKIISVSEGKVKIGISAPDHVKIFRGEVYEKVKQSTIEASNSSKQAPELNLAKLKINKKIRE